MPVGQRTQRWLLSQSPVDKVDLPEASKRILLTECNTQRALTTSGHIRTPQCLSVRDHPSSFAHVQAEQTLSMLTSCQHVSNATRDKPRYLPCLATLRMFKIDRNVKCACTHPNTFYPTCSTSIPPRA